MSAYLGEFAALLVSVAFTVNSAVFTIAGRQVGSMVVNRFRLILAVILLALTHFVLFDTFLPVSAEPRRWLWLSLSGISGLVLGDAFLFQAFVWIGPRLSMLMMSLVPVISTLLAWLFLNEQLSTGQVLGIGITIGGVAWVILERNNVSELHKPDYPRGILFGLGGAFGQALGLVLAKNGLGGEFSPISGNIIRMFSAGIILWGVTLFQKQAGKTIQSLFQSRQAAMYIFVGTFIGPFIGVSLSLFSIQHAEVGVASTLMALPPIFLLPIGHVFFQERYGWGGVAGTLLAIFGVAILFLV
ncbi:MAG: DMT family transporter [Anaerolineales bacterium]|jgi:drug/metabolite transporter (DMT)-like permease